MPSKNLRVLNLGGGQQSIAVYLLAANGHEGGARSTTRSSRPSASGSGAMGGGTGVTDYMLVQADARRIPLADGIAHCCVTSPPYWGLRDYGVNGQIGLEDTPDAYVTTMVAVMREVWRVLRDDGTLWLNLGDCYANDTKWGVRSSGKGRSSSEGGYPGRRAKREPGLQPKSLVGIPWRVALALQADGWILRSDIVWSKPNAMPEPVKDRPSRSHEYLFLLAKSRKYYFDRKGIAEPSVCKHSSGNGYKRHERLTYRDDDGPRGNDKPWEPTSQRNSRTVWQINTYPCSESHFAVMAPSLAERCIKAGCPADGVVLDPFNGAGTTGVVALGLGRRYVGCDINTEYFRMSKRRLERPHAPVDKAAGDGQAMPLFAVVEP